MLQIRKIEFSPNNIKANGYYAAFSKFQNSRTNLLQFEQRSKDRSSVLYHKLKADVDYWKSRVSKLSNVAGQEEEKILAKQQGNDLQQFGNLHAINSDPKVGKILNFIA